MAWLGLLATIVWNFNRHRRGLSTICSIVRRVLPWPAFVTAWLVFTGWMFRHIHQGYPRKD